MKYWRGYLLAAILWLCTWGLTEFSQAHIPLIDMVYPYTDRIVMDYLAAWSAGFAGCLWQVLYIFGILIFVASIVLMLVFRWNPIQWFGWVLVVVYAVGFLNTGIYGLNDLAGPITEDLRIQRHDYTLDTLERAAKYYRDQVNDYSEKVTRNEDGTLMGSDFDTLNVQAAEGFQSLVYDRTYSIFSGTTQPVKKLGFAEHFDGVTGKTVGLTGESAVNPNVPAVGMPFAICHEMSHRMCISRDSEADFGAFLSCTANSSPEFVYSGYLMAYRNCYNALDAIGSEKSIKILDELVRGTHDRVLKDMEIYEDFLGENSHVADTELTNLLVSWHIQEIARFEDLQEQENLFDPMDESNEQLQDILNPTEGKTP